MPQRAIVVGDVGDDPSAVEMALQRQAGIETFHFDSSTEALLAAPTLEPDVFLIGHREPQPDAVAFTASVRGNARFARTPVVVITGACAADVPGATECIEHSLDPSELARRVGTVVALEAASARADHAQVEAGRHARRLETLWRIGANGALSDTEYMAALLGAAALVLREGHPFVGAIFHLEGASLIVDVAVGHVAGGGLQPGQRVALPGSIAGAVLRAGHTRSWADAHADSSGPRSMVVPSLRAYVGTPFRVGPTAYVLAMGSSEPLEEPLGPLDHAYVETLASLCATRLHQRVQFDRLRYQSEHDSLTALRNRSAFRSDAAARLRERTPFALAVLDLDAFRVLNDTLGQQTADALLVEVGALLGSLAQDDVVARLTADDFAILMHGIQTRADAERRLLHYLEPFARPFTTGTSGGVQKVRLTASVGVALAPAHGTHVDRLLANAYEALKTAREEGRARWAVFDPVKHAADANATTLRDELLAAVPGEQLLLHFQPSVAVATGEVIGIEALVRWQHPQRGLLRPNEFVPFAEREGVIGPIDAWVLRETLRHARSWWDTYPGLRVWVNVSAAALETPALAALIEDERPLSGLGIEVTERTAMDDLERTEGVLRALRRSGVAIALDDFGVGYSSLARFRRLPIDLVKLDRAFAAGIPGDPCNEAIVEGMIGIGRRFGIGILAEGVETEAQLRWLGDMGCDYVQGFFIAPPMTSDATSAWLAQRYAGPLR
jgi:diguanylate cyclase (GGDEF)-like protein